MIINEKVDKKFIRDVFYYYENDNVKNKKDLKRPWIPKITYSNLDSEWFHVKLEYERGTYDAGLSASEIERLERKYRFCSMGVWEKGIHLTLKKSRWNTCDKCDKVIWLCKPFDGFVEWYTKGHFIELENGKHIMVCDKCFKSDKK